MRSAPHTDGKLPFASNRQILLVVVWTLGLAAVWTVFCMEGGRLIHISYGGGSIPFLNHIVTGFATHSLDEYLSRWSMVKWSGLGVVLSAGAFVVLATSSWPPWLVRFGPPVFAFLLARALLWFSFATSPAMLARNFSHNWGEPSGLAADEQGYQRAGAQAGTTRDAGSLSPQGYLWDGTPDRFVTSFNSQSWSRWDSHVYLSIARGGYEFYPCDIPRDGAPIARQGGWCGNSHWFPGYPAFIWLVARFGIPETVAGVLVSASFCLASLFLLWISFLGAEGGLKNALCLLFAALFPGSVYYHAIFPISMLTFFMLLSFHFAIRERWIPCALAASVASFTYPPGVGLALVFALWFCYWFKSVRWQDKLWRTVMVGCVTCAGTALVFLAQRFFIGAWFTYIMAHLAIKRDFGYTPDYHPMSVLVYNAQALFGGWATAAERVIPANTVFMAVVIILLIASSWQKASRSPAMSLQLIFLVVFWLALLSTGAESQIRKQALLLPAVPLGRNLPTWVLGTIVLVGFLLELLVGMFFREALVI